MTNDNPWAGLFSYEDPAKSTRQLKFCGRGNDIFDVTRLIDDNLLLILYGKSGIGKTSLLNAGVFPELRREQYLPISIRLGAFQEGSSYQKAIITSIAQAIQGVHGNIRTIDVIEEQEDLSSPDFLWNYFARHQFTNSKEQMLFPVVVLDQFEEVLRNSNALDQKEANDLLCQIQYLTDESHSIRDCLVNEKPYYYDFNFRFVISIREDDLYLLEDNIYSLNLNVFKQCRYRLRSLSEQQATEVILIPGKEFIKESESANIVRRIIELSKLNEQGSIDTLLLSLVCSGTFDRKKGPKITMEDLKVWKNNPMQVYYKEAVLALEDSKIRFIQNHLIKRDGSRIRVPVEDLKNAIGEKDFHNLTNGIHKILNILPNDHAELLHDQLAAIIFDDREAYEERELNWRFMEMQSRFVAEKAKALAAEDSYLARLLSINILPRYLDTPDRPYTTEAEESLREACRHDTAILKGHCDSVYSASYTRDGEHIVSASKDGNIIVWDARTGAILKSIYTGHNDITAASFSPDGNHVVIALKNNSIIIIDIETTAVETRLRGPQKDISCVCYSPDGNRVISASNDNLFIIWDLGTNQPTITGQGHHVAFSPDGKHVASATKQESNNTNEITIWNAWTGEKEATLPGHNNTINTIAYSPNGKRILSASNDKTIKIWSVRTRDVLMTIKNPKSRVIGAAYSPDGKYIVSSSMDKTLRIWKAKEGKDGADKVVQEETIKLVGHSDLIHSVAFSPDGSKIISTSRDKSTRIWDMSLYIPDEHHYETSLFEDLRPVLRKNNTRIKTEKNNVFLIDINTQKEITNFIGQIDDIVSASFSRNGKYIVSVSHYGTITVWDVKKEAKVWSFNDTSNKYESICFNFNGSVIIATTKEGSMRSWDFPPLQKLIDQTCERFKNRILSSEERKTYYLDFTDNDNKAQKQFWDTIQTKEYQEFVVHVLEKYYGSSFITRIHKKKFNVYCIPGKPSYNVSSIKAYDCLCDREKSVLTGFNIHEHQSYVFNKWYAEYSNIMDGKIHYLNRPGYMLDKVNTDCEGRFERMSVHIGTYGENVFSSHVLEYELYQAYLQFSQKDINAPDVWRKLHDSLTMRNQIHQNIGDPSEEGFKERMLYSLLHGYGRDSLLSVQMLVVVKSSKSGAYELKIAQRSNSVALKPGVHQFIPAGGFDILNDSDDDKYDDLELSENFSPGCAIFREYLEEMYNMPEFEGSGKGSIEERLMQDPHIKVIETMLANGEADFHFLGSIIDLTTLRHELSFVLVLHKDLYSNEQLIANDEFKKGLVMSIPIDIFDETPSIWNKIHEPSAALWHMFKQTSLFSTLLT